MPLRYVINFGNVLSNSYGSKCRKFISCLIRPRLGQVAPGKVRAEVKLSLVFFIILHLDVLPKNIFNGTSKVHFDAHFSNHFHGNLNLISWWCGIRFRWQFIFTVCFTFFSTFFTKDIKKVRFTVERTLISHVGAVMPRFQSLCHHFINTF